MNGWKISLWIGIVILTIWFLYMVRSILPPFILAFIIAILLDPTIAKLRRRGFSRTGAVLSVMGVFFLGITLLGVWVEPIISKQFSGFSDNMESITNRLAAMEKDESLLVRWNPVMRAKPQSATSSVDKILEQQRGLLGQLGLPATRQQLVKQYVEPHRDQAVNAAQNFFKGFLGLLGSAASQVLLLLFTPLFVLLILLDIERFRVRMASWIPPSIRRETVGLMGDIGEVFIRYLRGVTLAVGSYMILMSIVLTVLGVPYSVLMGLLVGAIYLIPYVGAAISAVSILLVVGSSGAKGNFFLSMSDPWSFAITVVAVFIVCHLVFDQLVYPRLVGKAVGLHPLVSMFVVFAGGSLFGLVGMLIAFPLAGSIKVILDRLIRVTSTATSESLNIPATPLRHRTASEL